LRRRTVQVKKTTSLGGGSPRVDRGWGGGGSDTKDWLTRQPVTAGEEQQDQQKREGRRSRKKTLTTNDTDLYGGGAPRWMGFRQNNGGVWGGGEPQVP